jgi:phenylacetate-CoA ligase
LTETTKHQSSSESGDPLKILFHYNTYKKTYNFLKESEWWDKDRLEEYQLLQLRTLLRHAYEHVPYYTRLFKAQGLTPSAIQDLSDLKNIPYLTRQHVMANPTLCRATTFSNRHVEYLTTRGSTGTPMGFYVEAGHAEAVHLAYFQDLLDRFHCRFTHRKVNILRNTKPVQYQLLSRSLTLSPLFMTHETIPLYLRKIRSFNPEYLLAYPSAMTLMARHIIQEHLTVPTRVKSIVCSGETIYEWQRTLIKEIFNCPLGTYYGHSEQAVFSGNCDQSDNYHVSPQYGTLEVINQRGEPVKRGEMGEIVVTGFHNYAFPFIRYRTGDVGVFATRKCDCGRDYPLLERVEGRLQEFVVLRSGQLIPLTGIFCSVIADFTRHVTECQFLQEVEGQLVFSIVRANEYTLEDERRMLENFRKTFGDQLKLSIRYTDAIPLAQGGKRLFLVQKLPVNFYNG